MPIDKKSSGRNRAGQALGHVAAFAGKHGFWVLAMVALSAVASVWVAKERLRLDADLTGLLPKSFASVQALEQLKTRYRGIGYVAVAAHSQDHNALIRFADDLAKALEALPDVEYVDLKRPDAFFRQHGLYYLDIPSLKRLKNKLADRADYEKKRRNPLYFELEERPPFSLALADLVASESADGNANQDPSLSRFAYVKAQLGETYYIDRAANRIFILAKPGAVSTDMAYAKKIVLAVKDVVGKMDLASYAPDLSIEYGGNYTKKLDQQALLERDLGVATTWALALMVLFVAFHFRRLAAVVWVVAPLITGLVWTYAFAAVAMGTLNILTGFIGAILLGLGIDHGIHLLGRFESEWSQYQGSSDAAQKRARTLQATFSSTGKAVLLASTTTWVAFAGLGFSEFRAFHEFGILAAAGMMLMALAYLVVLPAFLGLGLKFGWQPRAIAVHGQIAPFARWLPRRARPVAVVCLVFAAMATSLLPKVGFNANFRSLLASDLPSFKMDAHIDAMLGHSQTPMVALANSPEDEKLIAQILRAQDKKLGEASTIDFIASAADLIPEQQLEKKPHLEAIAEVLASVRRRWLPKKQRHTYDDLKQMTAAKTFAYKDLPLSVRRKFDARGQDQNSARTGFVQIYANVDLSDGSNVSTFARQLRSAQKPGGEQIQAAGGALVMADIFDMVRREAPPVLAATLVAVFAVLCVLLGSVRLGLWCLLPAALTLGATLGLIAITAVEINYINVIMIPVLFGIGVDGGVHLITRFEEEDTADPAEALSETGRAVAGAIFTTMLGFGAMLLADHRGLNSLGALAVLGLGINVLATNVALPACVLWWRARRKISNT